MVEVYFYLPARHVENAIACGIKLSEWYSKEVELGGEKKKCISALLNPGDDKDRYASSEFRCLKLEVMPKYCYAADSYLYLAGVTNPDVMEMYRESIISIEQYRFGQFRLPECLVTCTVLGENVKVLDKRLDSPILYSNSEELYMGNMIESFKEAHSDFNDALLYFFFNKLTEIGKLKKIEDAACNMAIFSDAINGKVYTIKIPDMERF
jgi:hypothetical protein